jgi:hypothetical protein
LDHVRSGADDIGEIEYGVPVVQKLSPRLRSAGLDELPFASEGQLEQVYVSAAVIMRIELQHCRFGCLGRYPTCEMPMTGGHRHCGSMEGRISSSISVSLDPGSMAAVTVNQPVG